VSALAEVLTAPLLIAAAVLGAAGMLKLRSHNAAARAFGALGLPASRWLVRALALVELALAVWCAINPGRAATAAAAALYGGFAGAAAVLARGHSACGCFGEDDAPASGWQSIISAAFALVAIAATVTPAHGLSWVLDRPVFGAGVLIIGIVGAAYATVVAYTELPRAWGIWSVR
jgi:hypothetical protein